MLHTPELDPDTTHPVILYDDLYAEDPRAPQTQFVLERQIAFLEVLAVSGSVRAAARRVKVSHQTCYRARRGSAAFGRAWDAALVIARAQAEAKLADYAMAGVREEVWYHGELVGYRTRFSERLLLAHLARLDRMRGDERVEALAEDFDAMLQRMRSGQGIEEAACVPAEAGTSGVGALHKEAPAFAGEQVRSEISASGQCNRRSMSHDTTAPVCPDCGGQCDDPQAIAQGLLGPQDCQWLGNRLDRMHAARPLGVKSVTDLVREMLAHMYADMPGPRPNAVDLCDAVEAFQLEAFEAEGHEWWLVTDAESLMASCTISLPKKRESAV